MVRARRLRSALSEERGSLLIEVMVGAIVLAIATFAVLDGLEGAQATGASNKQRSVASTLAQQDIERLRSYQVAALSNLNQTRTVNVAGVSYTVHSLARWHRDAAGTNNCTDQTGQADYLKITSTVQSPAQDNPVREISLLTPSAGSLSDTNGTLAVKVTDRQGTPMANRQVNVSGPGSYSELTNALGCAVFDFIPAGAYTIDLPGLVSWGGEGATPPQATVVAGTTSLKPVEVDLPASLRAHLKRPDGTAASWTSITVANAKLPGGVKTFGSAAAATAVDGTGLFPFLDGYGVYAGTCARNNPAAWQTNYYSASGFGFVVLAPGDFLKDVNVQMGVLNVNVKNSSGTNVSGAIVTVRQQDTGNGCTQGLLMKNGTTDASGNVSWVLPFGTYRVCTSAVVGTQTRRRETSGTSGSTQDPRLRPPSNLTFNSNLSLPGSGSSTACSTT